MISLFPECKDGDDILFISRSASQSNPMNGDVETVIVPENERGAEIPSLPHAACFHGNGDG
uniref:Uncharacterized protein n=1 Tax=Candidatus Kentrum sp. LFY TaxID=2126342 RepID=A0A450WS28_9GAMM|nr:MAG: hypothetical protein BECKLFY1418C_GA0070996_106420 [Candidatus Kentron sp. LFY]